ncbi:MAG: multidrug efflux MFS transporter [Clostridiales Family XIII bacterium]|jgi:EmrB/QacA subfamily drug resistance transporter|nr:multidrug efflux MFS transporter [Clostridiales Family XIII bacterium]
MENAATKLDPTLVRIALVLVLGMAAPALDATIVNVAIQTITAELNTDISVAQWLTTSYVLVLGIAVPLSAWLVNRFPAKKVYLASIGIFFAGSAGAMFTWNMESLIAFRVLQGIGAGILMPVMQTILVRYSGGQKLGRLMAIISIPAAVIPILGPTAGGLIVHYLPWRWIFAINIPICIASFIFLAKILPPAEAADKEQRLDLIGLILLASAFCTLIFGISGLRGDNTCAAAVKISAGIVLLLVYCVYVLLGKQAPLLDVRLFKRRNFSASTALLFVFGMVSTGTLFVLPLFFQQVYGTTAFVAGMLLAPQGIGMLLTRSTAGKLVERVGAKSVAITGVLLILLGTIPLAFLENGANIIWPALALLVRGGGIGVMSIAIMVAIYDGLDAKEAAQGTTAMRIFQQIGGAFGTALFAIILSHGLASPGNAHVSLAFAAVFWWSAGFAAVCAIPAICLNGKKAEV